MVNKLQEAMKDESKLYIIGETAYNHEGDLDYLKKMVDDLSGLKVQAVKFHLLSELDSYMQKKHPLKEALKQWIFNADEWEEIINYSHEKNLDVIALCDDVESIKLINKKGLKVEAVELHATGINDYFMLEEAGKSNAIIVLGIGGTEIDEVNFAINFLKEKNKTKEEILLMYGFQSYPTDYAQINLQKMRKIQTLFNLKVGYADHTSYDDKNNELVSALGAANGFNILEKHYTPDFGKERVDFHAAIGKEQFVKLKKYAKLFLKIYGSGSISMTEAELKYGNVGPMKKAIVAKKKIAKGEKLSMKNLWFKRTEEESNIKQTEFVKLIGLKTNKDISEDKIIKYEDLEFKFQEANLANFTHKRSDK